MQENTFADYIHFGIALAVASALCFVLLAKQPWTVQATSFALILCAYLFHYWREPSKEIAVQETSPDTGEDFEDAPDLAMPSIAMPTPSRVDGNRVATTGNQAPTRSQNQKPTFWHLDAAELNRLLKERFGVSAAIPLWDKDAIVPAYGFVNYELEEFGKVEFLKLNKVADDLARGLKAAKHRKPLHGEVRIVVQNSQPLVLQVTHPKPRNLPWTDRPAPQALKAALGYYWRGSIKETFWLDMTSDRANGAIFGMPGGGKSVALHSILIQLIDSTGPDKLQIYGIDTNTDTFATYDGLPHLAQHTSDKMIALDILQQFAYWCNDKTAPKDGIYRVLVIDELQELMKDKDIGESVLSLFETILSGGRKHFIRVISATQLPDAKSYPTSLKFNTHWMASGFVLNDDYLSSQLDLYGSHALPEKGEMVCRWPGRYATTSVFWLPKEQWAVEAQRLRQKWGTMTHVKANDFTSATPLVSGGTPVATPLPAPVAPPVVKVEFPVDHRPLSPNEQAAVRVLAQQEDHKHRGTRSLNKLCATVYGCKNAENMEWIKEALGE